MWCRYDLINFLQNIHERHPIARPSGQDMGCLLWVQPPCLRAFLGNSRNPGLLWGARRATALGSLLMVWLPLSSTVVGCDGGIGAAGGCAGKSQATGWPLDGPVGEEGMAAPGITWGWEGATFRRNLRFLRVTLPDPSTLIRYCRFGITSTTRPERSHRFVCWSCIATKSLTCRSGRLWAVRLYASAIFALRLASNFSLWFAAMIHSGWGL